MDLRPLRSNSVQFESNLRWNLQSRVGCAEKNRREAGFFLRATADTSANFLIRFSVKKRKVRAEKILERPHVQVLLERAEMWQALLDSGEVKTRVDLAKRFGVAAGRVSNILNLLKLAQEIQRVIRELPVGTSRRVVSEHGLRELARMPVGEQRRQWNGGRGSWRFSSAPIPERA